MTSLSLRAALLATAVCLTTTSGVAYAQSEPAASAPKAKPAEESKDIVITGSLIRRRDLSSSLPITILSSADLEKRGVVTITDAIQTLANNGSGALPNSFSANGAFANGASGASLRGLTTNSTLVLFDGLRAAYYPLADDGTRNFVDLNTIPDAIVERVDVLKDGAASAYGADAIAGVVNVVTKKQFKGFELNVEGGISGQGDAGQKRITATYGHGDLKSDGYNFYISGEYQKDDALYNRDRGFPFNTADLSSICGTSVVDGTKTCRTNGIANGLQFDGSFQPPNFPPTAIAPTTVAQVAPTDAMGNITGLWQPIAGSCGALNKITVGGVGTVCQQDFTKQYGVITPNQERFGASARLTVRVGDRAEAYAAFNYYQDNVNYINPPNYLNYQSTPGSAGTVYNTFNLTLPVYVCAGGVNCTAANGKLNPNNPFAAQGQQASIVYRFGDINAATRDLSQTYRGAVGLSGGFGHDWKYDLSAVAMRSDLSVTQTGVLYIQSLLNAVADGSYNFVDPSQNSASVRNTIAPVNIQKSNSQEVELKASLSKALFDLPGGALQAVVGGEWRYESVYNPSANNDTNGATNRWFSINPFGAIGHRYVGSGFFEVDAPIVKALTLNASGRYDSYSTGQSHFSPKISGKFEPIKQIKLRGSYSRGFRIPSFAEANALPTTGFITVSTPASFLAAHGNDPYAQSYNLGLTTLGTPSLQPEKSENITGGIVFEPNRHFSFTADFYSIRKTNVIVGANYNAAVAAYYAGQPIPAGFKVTPDVADPAAPNALPRIAFVQYGFVNANSLITTGIDLSATARFDIGKVRWSSSVQATDVLKYNVYFPDGSAQHFVGTIGPCATTSCSGTPRWRATWANTLDFDKASVTATAYYTSGYNLEAEDFGGISGDCLGSVGSGTPSTFRDGATPTLCRTAHFLDVDMHGSYEVTKHVTLYADVLNVFNVKPAYDPVTYGAVNYNPAWSNSGIIGRYIRVGAKVKF